MFAQCGLPANYQLSAHCIVNFGGRGGNFVTIIAILAAATVNARVCLCEEATICILWIFNSFAAAKINDSTSWLATPSSLELTLAGRLTRWSRRWPSPRWPSPSFLERLQRWYFPARLRDEMAFSFFRECSHASCFPNFMGGHNCLLIT